MGRLCVLAIILLASPTLPREVLVLESSTFPVTLPTVGALDVATCADLNATAADLCTREGIAAAQHDACIDQFVVGLAARRDATLAASGLAALRLRVAYSRDGSSVSAARVGDDELLLRVPTDRYLLAYRLASAARLVARDACAQLQGGPTSLDTRAAAPAAACGRCEKSLFDTLARSAAAEPTVDETGWSLRDGATIRRAFGGRLSRSQCVTPRPELWLDSAALAAGPEGVDTWPRAFWRVTEGSGVVAAGHARDVTGRRRDVACASADAPVRVWLNLTDLTTFGYWELDDHFSTLARHADNEGCADRCVLAASPADATLLVSEHAPSVKARAGQRTVHMSIEAKDLMSAHVGDFDLTMDMSLFSNVPLLWAPLGLRARARALPKPTLADLSSRRLLVWASSNCHRTTWDRYGYAQALQRELGDEFDAAGKCLRNPASAQRDFAPMTRNDSWSHATASGNARQWGLYGQYLFVLSLSNAIEDDNVDEKFFQPFLANSVPVAVVGSAARRLAPGGRGSFVDATQYVVCARAPLSKPGLQSSRGGQTNSGCVLSCQVRFAGAPCGSPALVTRPPGGVPALLRLPRPPLRRRPDRRGARGRGRSRRRERVRALGSLPALLVRVRRRVRRVEAVGVTMWLREDHARTARAGAA